MKLKKPKFWDLKEPNIYAHLLRPLSKITELSYLIRNKSKKKYLNIKTICVGNIYIGGTGKTSLAIKINDILKKNNIRCCFIKKLYANQIDEVNLLKKHGEVFSDINRINCLENAIKENYEFAIFDDGLQDCSVDYDLKILCFNNINWIGNGLVLPAGPLRENLINLKKYNYIFLNGNLENVDKISEEIYKINSKSKIFCGTYLPKNIDQFNLMNKYLVFSGIGNHGTFVSMLKKNNFKILKDIEFPDHYNYKKKELDKIILESRNLNCSILTTEKDFLRINNPNLKEINFIKSELSIRDEEKFTNDILNLNENY